MQETDNGINKLLVEDDKMEKRLIMGMVVLAVLAVGIWIYTGSSGFGTNVLGSITPPAQNSKSAAGAAVKEFNVTAFQFGFDPSTIVVNNGDIVRLKVTSRDVTHGIAIRDFDVNEVIEPGKIATIEFTANKTGNFTFYCSVYCGSGHREQKGTLIVK